MCSECHIPSVNTRYSDAEQALQKADRISQERSKLSCVTDKECNQFDILLYQAMARYVTQANIC